MYHNIIVENTGSCPITKVFTSITLPPYEEPFDYQNVNKETGELYGLSNPELPGSIELGGTVVLSSVRLPIITIGSVECEASCMGAAPEATSSRSIRTSPPLPVTTKVEIEWGANPRWIALSLIDDIDTSDVWIIDATNSRNLMKRENWDTKTAYTFSPSANPLTLPLSVELKSKDGEVISLKNFITSFSYAILDTQAGFPHSPAAPTANSLRLVAHPSSNPHWIALTPYGLAANSVTSISIKAANPNSGYAPMNLMSVGFFAISSPNLALQLPISAQVTFADGRVLFLNDVVAF
jgi:hypothetical protein